MRRLTHRALAPVVLVALVLAWTPAAWPASERDEGVPGGGVVDGTPVAVVVRGPSGELASYTRPGGGSGPRWTCAYYGFESASPTSPNIAVDYSSGPIEPEAGRTYVLACRDATGNVVHTRFALYDPADPLAGLFAAERAAASALEQLPLDPPEVAMNPPGDQVVGVPTWFWVGNAWADVEASASLGGVTSTVTATPVRLDWHLGDGTSLTCIGGGAVYDPTRPAGGQVSDCTHTFVWPSTDRPLGVYAVTAVLTYTAGWRATTGESGDLGEITRTTTTAVRVVEVQAVIQA